MGSRLVSVPQRRKALLSISDGRASSFFNTFIKIITSPPFYGKRIFGCKDTKKNGEIQRKSEKSGENSEKIRENRRNSEKIREIRRNSEKNQRKTEKIREKSEKIIENRRKS